jgi:hypothetical protein
MSAPISPEEMRNQPRVFRVNHAQNRKPMTLDEALLEMENDLDYLAYSCLGDG